jgi:hypothetical protein
LEEHKIMSALDVRVAALTAASAYATSVDELLSSASRIAAFLSDDPAGRVQPTESHVARPTNPASAKASTPSDTSASTSGAAATPDVDETVHVETAASTETPVDEASLRAAANAAVLSAVKPTALGRDIVVKVLTQHGGAKVPLVPADKLPALIARLDPSNYDAIRKEFA